MLINLMCSQNHNMITKNLQNTTNQPRNEIRMGIGFRDETSVYSSVEIQLRNFFYVVSKIWSIKVYFIYKTILWRYFHGLWYNIKIWDNNISYWDEVNISFRKTSYIILIGKKMATSFTSTSIPSFHQIDGGRRQWPVFENLGRAWFHVFQRPRQVHCTCWPWSNI